MSRRNRTPASISLLSVVLEPSVLLLMAGDTVVGKRRDRRNKVDRPRSNPYQGKW